MSKSSNSTSTGSFHIIGGQNMTAIYHNNRCEETNYKFSEENAKRYNVDKYNNIMNNDNKTDEICNCEYNYIRDDMCSQPTTGEVIISGGMTCPKELYISQPITGKAFVQSGVDIPEHKMVSQPMTGKVFVSSGTNIPEYGYSFSVGNSNDMHIEHKGDK